MFDSYELRDIKSFMMIARTGSISRASTMYNVPKATLSHHLRRLEDYLKVELFVRKTKGLELTDAGREFLEHSACIVESCEAATNAAQRAHSSLSGRIRIIASSAFGTALIGAAATHFSAQHPNVDFDLQVYPNEKLLAGQFDFDCMIFVGDPPASSLLQRKMGEVSFGLYASPAFIGKYGQPQSLDDIKSLEAVVYLRDGLPEKWNLRDGKKEIRLEPRAKFNVNEYWMAKYLVVETETLGYLPDFFVRNEVSKGILIPILPDLRSDNVPVFAVYPSQRHRTPRIMRLIEDLCKHYQMFIRSPGYSVSDMLT